MTEGVHNNLLLTDEVTAEEERNRREYDTERDIGDYLRVEGSNSSMDLFMLLVKTRKTFGPNLIKPGTDL